MSRNSKQYLRNCVIRDLISDIRFTRRLVEADLNKEENEQYLERCLAELTVLLKEGRHSFKLDGYGYPKVLKNVERVKQIYRSLQ